MSNGFDWIFKCVALFQLLNAICAAILLLREIAISPRSRRARWIALSLALMLLATVQIATGYYFAFGLAQPASYLTATVAYLLGMILLLAGKRMAWHLNRIVALTGIIIPVLNLVISPAALVILIFISMAAIGNPFSAVHGRLSPTISYRVAIHPGLLGGSSYRYTIFRNPRWFPFVRKEIVSNVANPSCDFPADAVGVRAGQKKDTAIAWCRSGGQEYAQPEIPLN